MDILGIMPARNQHDQAIRIRWELPAPFPTDLLVRTPQNMHWRLAEGDSFLREIMSKGKVLYEKVDGRVGEGVIQAVGPPTRPPWPSGVGPISASRQ